MLLSIILTAAANLVKLWLIAKQGKRKGKESAKKRPTIEIFSKTIGKIKFNFNGDY